MPTQTKSEIKLVQYSLIAATQSDLCHDMVFYVIVSRDQRTFNKEMNDSWAKMESIQNCVSTSNRDNPNKKKFTHNPVK